MWKKKCFGKKKQFQTLLNFLKDMLGEKENICNPSSSDNITKEVIFVILLELQLFLCKLWNEIYTAMELYSSSETMFCFISKKDPTCAVYLCLPSYWIITLSISSNYFAVPWLFFSILLLLQSTLHLHRIKITRRTTETKKKRINSCKKKNSK